MASKCDRNSLDSDRLSPSSSPERALSFSSWCQPIDERADSLEREETSDSCADSVQSLLCDEELLTDDLDLSPPVDPSAQKRSAAGPPLSPDSLYGARKRLRLSTSPAPRGWQSVLGCVR